MTLPRKGRRAVVGIDLGPMSGRAVVVSVGDGTTLGGRGANDVMHRLRVLRRKAGRD